MSAARPEGLGSLFASAVPRTAVAVLWVAVAAGLASLGRLAGQPWWQGALATLLALGAASLLLRRCVQRFAGMTGDVLGALVETALTVLLLVTVFHLA